MTRSRMAFFTPLRPQASGVSDYSEELLPHLGRLAEIDLIAPGYKPSNPRITHGFRVIRAEEFLARKASYDCVIYQVANNLDHHGYMVPCMEKVPGVLVLHDCCLQYLMLGLTLRRGDMRALRAALAPQWGGEASKIIRRLLLGTLDPNTISFARPLVEASRAVIVHSEAAKRKVLAEMPEAKVSVIPMGVPLDEDFPTAQDVRRRHGIAQGDFVLASISTLSYTKRLDLVIEALPGAILRCQRLKLLIAGGGSLDNRTRMLIRRLGLEQAVVRTGWVEDREYRGLINAADAVVDLRYPSGLETSASLSRAFAMGKPAIVSAQGTFAELPDACCLKIPAGQTEREDIARAVATLLDDPRRRADMGRAAREFAATRLRLEDAAAAYIRAAQDAAAAPPRSELQILSPHLPGPERAFVASVYKLSRLGYLIGHYGPRYALRRIREEAGR